MTPRSRLAFLAVVGGQAAHSVEEYATRLFDVFGPARFVSGILTDDLPVGFAIVNASFVLFGLGCWALAVRPGKPAARGIAWGWVALELGNGIGHSLLALGSGGYFPGVATAPLLVATSLWLAFEMTAPAGAATAAR